MNDEAPQHFDIPDVGVDLDYYTKAIFAIRAKTAEMDARHKDERPPLVQARAILEAAFLQYFVRTGSENFSVKGVGNVHRITRAHAKIADQASFQRHVIGTELWNLIDMKANAPAVREAIEAAGAPVPGVEYSETATIGFRKA